MLKMPSSAAGTRLSPPHTYDYTSKLPAIMERASLDAAARLHPPPRPSSATSFVSSGTIEVEGFGFDYDSDNDDAYSVFTASVYEESIADDSERRPSTPERLERRAERVLAHAKKKLDLCGANLSKARESMVISPTPQSPGDAHWRSFGGSVNERDVNNARPVNIAHLRTSSESAVNRYGSIGDVVAGAKAGSTSVDNKRISLNRSSSTQQMRQLRDQMKDLRGKITSLQQQARSDSMRRRSISSLRSNSRTGSRSNSRQETTQEDGYSMDSAVWVDDGKTLEEVREEDETEQEYETVAEDLDSDDEGSGTGTPKAVNPVRESRHEDREDAFSYDSLFLGNGLYATNLQNRRPLSIESVSSAGTTIAAPIRQATPPSPIRRESQESAASFRTATEGGSTSTCSSPDILPHHPLRPPPRTTWNPPDLTPRDDGYHSAPHTPKVSESGAGQVPLSTTGPRRLAPTPLSITGTLAPNNGMDDGELTPRRNSRIMSLSAGLSSDPHSPTAHNLLVTHHTGMAAGGARVSREIGLRLGNGDSQLVDRIVEILGRLAIEIEGGGRASEEARRKLEGALRVLEGGPEEDDDDGTF